jgi:hypothetical protein
LGELDIEELADPGFLQIVRLPPPINLTTIIHRYLKLKCCGSGIKKATITVYTKQ